MGYTVPLQLQRFSGNMEISWSFVNVKSIIELLNYSISTDTRLVKIASGHSWVAENVQKMYGCSLEEYPGLSLEFHIRKTLHYSANSVWFLRKRCSPLNVNCIVEPCNQLNRIPSNKITNMRLQYYIVISFIRFQENVQNRSFEQTAFFKSLKNDKYMLLQQQIFSTKMK